MLIIKALGRDEYISFMSFFKLLMSVLLLFLIFCNLKTNVIIENTKENW